MYKSISDKFLVNTAIAFVLFCFLVMESGCAYYKVTCRVDTQPDLVLDNLINDLFPPNVYPRDVYPESNLKLILLSGRDVYVFDYQGRWHIDNAMLKGDTIVGISRKAPVPAQNDPSYPENRKNRKYDKKTESQIVRRVNFYVDTLRHLPHDSAFFSTVSINKYEIYRNDQGKSAGVAIGIAIPIVLTVLGISLMIAATVEMNKAAKESVEGSSCPFVYTGDGDSWQFRGDIFPGATMKTLERDDYLPLPLDQAMPEGTYPVRIANMLQEIQYIDQADLVIVEHDRSVRPLIDKYGGIQTIGDPVTPSAAADSRGVDCLAEVIAIDLNTHDFNEDMDTSIASLNSLELTFRSASRPDTGKLIVSARNSLWGEYLVGELYSLFGKRYPEWQEKQEQKPIAEYQEWMQEQGLPLQVYALVGDEWVMQDYFELTGTFGYREMVMPLALKDAWVAESNGGPGYILKLKLVTGYYFWQLDYAAMDLAPNVPVNIISLDARSAYDQDSQDQISLLTSDDGKYLILDKPGEYADLEFILPDISDQATSMFLHARGYYQEAREYEGKPDLARLKTFREPGKLSRWSYENYKSLLSSITSLSTSRNLPR
jgi:hypothetical protein